MEPKSSRARTAFHLKVGGYEAFVVADATSSRSADNRDASLARMAANGVEVATAATIALEWPGRAGSDTFRELGALSR